MHQAEIHIQDPAGNTVYRQVHTAPASWKEMARAELLIWASVLSSGLKLQVARGVLAAMLFKIPLKYNKVIKPSASAVLAVQFDFLLKKNELYTWLIPSIWLRLFKYYGPKSGLSNLTVDEFGKCEQCYERFSNTKNPEFIDTLVAILYRPQRFWGVDNDIRVKLTDHGYISRAKRFKKLPQALKTAIYLNYEGNRHFLHIKYKEAFAPSQSINAAKLEITPWRKIIEAGANDIFGTLEATKNTNLHDFLSRLCTRLQEAKELEYKK